MKMLLLSLALVWSHSALSDDLSYKQNIEKQLAKTISEIKIAEDKIERLSSLLESLDENQANFAGYGVSRNADDVKRVRQSLYHTRAEHGELIAKKLYLKHSLNSHHTWKKVKKAHDQQPIESAPTNSPEKCLHGVINVNGRWFCVRKESKAPTSDQKSAQKPKCELGTIEVNGRDYCIGHEPGGVANSPSPNVLSSLVSE